MSCFSFSDHPGLKTSSPSHWSPNQWLLEISILEKPQEMGKIFSIGVNDLSPLESVRLRPGRFDDRFSCVSLFLVKLRHVLRLCPSFSENYWSVSFSCGDEESAFQCFSSCFIIFSDSHVSHEEYPHPLPLYWLLKIFLFSGHNHPQSAST